MAYYRNILLDYIRTHYTHYDYCMMVDLDLAGPISRDGLAHSLGYNRWDIITANGLANKGLDKKGTSLSYYDMLAYVDYNSEIPPIYNSITWFLKSNTLITYKKWNRGEPLHRVKSAFSGCAIYKMNVINDRRNYYSGEHCEHIIFHTRCISNGYDKIYLNPR